MFFLIIPRCFFFLAGLYSLSSNNFMKIIEKCLDLFFPPQCAACKKEGEFLCSECRTQFKIRPIRYNEYDKSYRSNFTHLNGVIYVADYAKNPQLQAAISQFKYKFTRELTSEFTSLMVSRLSELRMVAQNPFFLVPVPLHRKRLAYRGFNQSDLLANGIANRFENTEVQFVLRRIKNTPQQAKLAKKERHENLEGAFALNQKIDFLKEKICFLVDDVCTTGSTLEECARVLKEGGMKKVYGLVLARAL